METPSSTPKNPPSAMHRPLWALRSVVVALGLVAWFWTQSLISKRAFPAGVIGDNLHALTAPLNQYLLHHPSVTDGLLIVSSAFIDLFAIFLGLDNHRVVCLSHPQVPQPGSGDEQ